MKHTDVWYAIASIGIVGFLGSALGYLMRAKDAVQKSMWTVFGMLFVATGYLLLFATNTASVKKRISDKKLTKSSKMYIAASLILATFFIAIYIFPQLTFHVLWYDVFAGIGYLLSAFYNIIPIYIAYTSLVIYYTFGSISKIHETSWVDKLQLCTRLMLAGFYVISMFV